MNTRNYLTYFFNGFLLFFLILSSCKESSKVTVSESGTVVCLENNMVSLAFDSSTGTYSVTDKSSACKAISNAAMKINDWKSSDEGLERTWTQRSISDKFGNGMALDLELKKENHPTLLFTFRMYEGDGFIHANGGINNTTGESIQIKEIYLVSDGKLYAESDVSENFAMVDGFSGGEPLEYGKECIHHLQEAMP